MTEHTYNTTSIPTNARFSLQPKPSALVVESDELARTIAAEIATTAGFEVHAASCCDSAVSYVTHHGAVELLLIAAKLPEMPGHELAGLIARDFPHVLSIFLVREDDPHSYRPMLRYPFTLDDLADTLDTLGVLPRGVRTQARQKRQKH